METQEITARLAEIQEELSTLTDELRQLSWEAAQTIGTDETAGINLTELSEWARAVKKVNSKIRDLANERRTLKAERRAARPCTCDCHTK